MFYCDTSLATLARADRAWARLKEVAPAVCLLVVESAPDTGLAPGQASRTEIMAWCLEHQFESLLLVLPLLLLHPVVLPLMVLHLLSLLCWLA